MNGDAVGSLFQLALCPQWTGIACGKSFMIFLTCVVQAEARVRGVTVLSVSSSATSFMTRPSDDMGCCVSFVCVNCMLVCYFSLRVIES